MAMLAERKRKKKWTLLPKRVPNKPIWLSETEGLKFGQKLMEKMGWTAGKGLGANEQGMQEPLRVSYKNDTKGMGYKLNEDEWIEQQDEFNDLLAHLRGNAHPSLHNSCNSQKAEIQSLEEKSKKSKSRVHYQKFLRGKDLSRYSENDLACILGKNKQKPDINSFSGNQTDFKESSAKDENTFGVKTIHGGSITDYFTNKWAKLKQKNKETERESNSDLSAHSIDNSNQATIVTNNCDNIQDCLNIEVKEKKSKKRKQLNFYEQDSTENSTDIMLRNNGNSCLNETEKNDTEIPKKKVKMSEKYEELQNERVSNEVPHHGKNSNCAEENILANHDIQIDELIASKRKKKKKKSCEDIKADYVCDEQFKIEEGEVDKLNNYKLCKKKYADKLESYDLGFSCEKTDSLESEKYLLVSQKKNKKKHKEKGEKKSEKDLNDRSSEGNNLKIKDLDNSLEKTEEKETNVSCAPELDVSSLKIESKMKKESIEKKKKKKKNKSNEGKENQEEISKENELGGTNELLHESNKVLKKKKKYAEKGNNISVATDIKLKKNAVEDIDLDVHEAVEERKKKKKKEKNSKDLGLNSVEQLTNSAVKVNSSQEIEEQSICMKSSKMMNRSQGTGADDDEEGQNIRNLKKGQEKENIKGKKHKTEKFKCPKVTASNNEYGKQPEKESQKKKNVKAANLNASNETNIIHTHKESLFRRKIPIFPPQMSSAKALRLYCGAEVNDFKGSNLGDLEGYGMLFKKKKETLQEVASPS